MRCYSCDRINASHNDGTTGRTYCSTCWDIIELAIGKKKSLTEKHDDATIDVLMEEEVDIADAIIESRSHTSEVS